MTATAEYGEWGRKNATLSDKSARKEYGLTDEEIAAAIDAGHLQYRVGFAHGNPLGRLLRREVEALMESVHNDQEHRIRRGRADLARIDKRLPELRTEVAVLEAERTELIAAMPELGSDLPIPASARARRRRRVEREAAS